MVEPEEHIAAIQELADRLARGTDYSPRDCGRLAAELIRMGLDVEGGVRFFAIAGRNLYVAEKLAERRAPRW